MAIESDGAYGQNCPLSSWAGCWPASPATTRGCRWGLGRRRRRPDRLLHARAGCAPRAATAGRRPGGPPGGAATGAGADDDRLLVAKTDPITFATDLIGWYAVHVNANDIACAGATPRVVPGHGAAARAVGGARGRRRSSTSWARPAPSLGVTLVGGHTEITGGTGAARWLSGCMLGEVERAQAVRTGGGAGGRRPILTRGHRRRGDGRPGPRGAPAACGRGGCRRRPWRAPSELLFTPGISVVPAAQACCATRRPPRRACTACTTPRKGASRRGSGRWPRPPGRGRRSRPRRSPSCRRRGPSATPWASTPTACWPPEPSLPRWPLGPHRRPYGPSPKRGIPARVVGRLTPREEGLWRVEANGERRPWPSFDRDELARYFAERRLDGRRNHGVTG